MATGRQGGGLRGSTQAQIHDVFNARINELAADGVALAAAVLSGSGRVWQVPAAAGDLLEIETLSAPFDRQAINTNYELVMQDPAAPGTIGDVIALTRQIDFVAAEERAFRVRHMTPVRALCHAAGRRYGMGAGGVFEPIRDEVAAAIQAGGAR
jgi:hypothetical protein